MLTVAGLLGLVLLGLVAGSLGALVGIGGGIIIIPALVLVFDVDIRVAVATSLVAVVATSTAAGSVYVGEGLANMRLGMTLEVATTLGGITGGLAAAFVEPRVLAGLFAVLTVLTAALMVRSPGRGTAATPVRDGAPEREVVTGESPGSLRAAYFDRASGDVVAYAPRRVGAGSAISFVAGVVSGLLGVGGGFLKVPAMTLGMGVPVRAAAATSNFMIGVTAIASLFVYFARGFVHPSLAAPVTVGVVAGAMAGTVTAERSSPRLVRITLAVVLIAVAVQMTLEALGYAVG